MPHDFWNCIVLSKKQMHIVRVVALLILNPSFGLSARPSMATADQEILKPSKGDRIAIIGGGVSGLTAAFRLEQLGFEAVTLYEQEGHFGGKVYSYDYDGAIYEAGAIWAAAEYDVILEMAAKFNFSFVPDQSRMLVRFEDGSDINYGQVPSNVLSEMIAKYYSWSNVANKYGYLTEPDGFFKASDPDLYLNFDQFAKRYDIEVFATYFRPFWIGCGYSYYETTPAMYVLKLALQIAGVILNSGIPEPQFTSKLLIAPEGFQNLLVEVGKSLSDARLNSEVTSVQRTKQGNATFIEIVVDGMTEIYDHLIITTDLRSSLRYLDASKEEFELFTRVVSHNLVVQLTRMNSTTDLPITLFFDEFATPNTSGHVVTMRNIEIGKYVWYSEQIDQWNRGLEQLNDLLKQDFAGAGLSLIDTVKQFSWNYFPHVGKESLKEGFYPRINALQGVRNTFYLGGVLGFETVEGTSAFANMLIMRQFS
eukprot:CAMPEP_0118801244 /NCGR_PEP_ID=MMETSP1161-20130426/2863_1 /TAXON_ID=249345 /ORGANISM="Picochlorum oklahomensis, Strain CCMP2329" /LENGTH=478 /DNA_ID=CAMNT_0006729147 /DNA_START=122 /DNA_END=1558 /DNA_ORIENTATION=+